MDQFLACNLVVHLYCVLHEFNNTAGFTLGIVICFLNLDQWYQSGNAPVCQLIQEIPIKD